MSLKATLTLREKEAMLVVNVILRPNLDFLKLIRIIKKKTERKLKRVLFVYYYLHNDLLGYQLKSYTLPKYLSHTLGNITLSHG